MAKVTEQTVEIKKSPRSTFALSSSKCGSARIGDLNMVFHKMMEPSDMIRCQVDTQILFISPLQVPAFAKMKVFTYYFFDSYQNVFDDFNNVIQNYTHETREWIENGRLQTSSAFKLPYIKLHDLSAYICCGLHWAPPIVDSPTATVLPPFGDSSYEESLYNEFYNYPMLRNMVFSTYEQKVDIVKLCNQFDIPYGALIPLSKEFQMALSNYITNKTTNIDSDFNWETFSSDIKRNIAFLNYWRSPVNFAGDSKELQRNYVFPNFPHINILPFKIYQHIYNDWFLDTQKNPSIDIYNSIVTKDLNFLNGGFYRSAGMLVDYPDQTAQNVVSFDIQQFKQSDNLYMNSIFAIRRPWYSKDYFNVSTNDPSLGVSPYAVGTSILDLRKNSALQRLAEKKALCGNKLVDFIAQHFNYYPPELDISRSIHLGTSVDYVTVSQVLQTSQTTDSSPQGERAATAQAYGRSKGVFFKAPCYGEFMVLQVVKPEIDYYEGIPKEMQITDAADMPLPELSQIGFDTIQTSELYVTPFGASTTFGYTPRYSWRKTQLNRIYGELCNTLNFWHQSPSLRFGVTNDYRFGQIGFDTWSLQNTPYRELGIQNPSFNRIFSITDINQDTYVYQHAISCTLNTCLPTNDSPQL